MSEESFFEKNSNKANEDKEKVKFVTGYTNSPLSFGGRRRNEQLPEKLQQMKAMYNVFDRRLNSESYYFYRQGKFMEDYEENFEFKGVFNRFFPTYHIMTNDQLRGYFDFRTKIRKCINEDGDILSFVGINVSYLYVYIYEILNNIGIKDPEKGLEILKIIRNKCSKNAGIFENISKWIVDYIIYYDIPFGKNEEFFIDDSKTSGSNLGFLYDFDKMICEDKKRFDFLSFEEKKELSEKLFNAINSVSNYKFTSSAFYKKNTEDVFMGVLYCYTELSLFFKEHGFDSFFKKIFGEIQNYPYRMFYKAVFYDHLKRKDYVYEISSTCRFFCSDEVWYKYSFEINNKSVKTCSEILREIDRIMRKKFKFGKSLAPKFENMTLSGVIDSAIDKFITDKKKAMMPKIEIDMSKLQAIRDDSVHTRDKLIVDVDEYEDFSNSSDQTLDTGNGHIQVNTIEEDINNKVNKELDKKLKKETNPETYVKFEQISTKPGEGKIFSQNENTKNYQLDLSDDGLTILKLLLEGTDVKKYALENHLMLSIVISKINEAFYDEIGDVIIEFDGDNPILIEDYIGDVKEIIGE